MPGRNIPAPLLAALQEDTLRVCICVQIARQDGVVFGFTTHDRDVILDGVTYQASSAVQASNIRQEAGGSADNMDTVGILSSMLITEMDMRAGAYDNADIRVLMCDWSNVSLGSFTLMRGNIGDVTLVDGQYTAAFRSLMQRFQQQVGELYSPTCRVFKLGDARCKFNLAGNTVDGNPATSNVSIASVLDPTVLTFVGGVDKVGYYNYGVLKSISGQNTGFSREVKLHGAGSGLASTTVSPTGVPSGLLPFRRSFDFSSSQDSVFAVPAGQWDMASIAITSHWAIVDVTRPGTDQLTIQFPPGQANDVILRTNSLDGVTYNDVLQLGNTTMGLINAAAGGSMTLALRHTQPSSENHRYFDLDIPSIVLTLVGPGAGTSSRLVLHEAFPYPVSVGDVFQAVTGCNRLSGTCTQKFANIINFRGEPTLPGTEKLLERGRPPQ